MTLHAEFSATANCSYADVKQNIYLQTPQKLNKVLKIQKLLKELTQKKKYRLINIDLP